jgi:nitroreductase
MLGLSTGCCSCFDDDKIRKILNINDSVLLLMGIGYPNDNKNRREHHKDQNFMFPTFSKKMEVIKI